MHRIDLYYNKISNSALPWSALRLYKCLLILTESKAKFLKSTVPFCTCEPKLVVRPLVDSFGRSADNLQQEQEDLDDVDIDGERGEHILFRADGVLPVSYQKLRVVRQELQDIQETFRITL